MCALQVLAQSPASGSQNKSATIFTGVVVPANADALPDTPVPSARGMRLDAATPYHAFLWPNPAVETVAAGSVALTMYNDTRSVRSFLLLSRQRPTFQGALTAIFDKSLPNTCASVSRLSGAQHEACSLVDAAWLIL
jgi:hypothetical protein